MGVDCATAATSELQGRAPRWLRVQTVAWTRLVSHRAQHPRHITRQYEEIATVLGSPSAVDALCRFGCNNFAAANESGTIGHLCCPLVSLLLNHSCLPNAAYAYTASGELLVTALTDIRSGDEISLAYVDGLLPRSQRQKELSAVYFFDCKCIRCSGQAPRALIDELMDRKPEQEKLPSALPTDFAMPAAVDGWALKVVAVLLANAGDSLMLEAVRGQLARDVSFVAYSHWRECQDECLDRVAANESDAQWPWAAAAALHVLAFYALAYPPTHPLVGRQCLKAAQLAWNALQSSSANQGVADRALVGALASAAQSILEPPSSSSVGRQIFAILDLVNEK
ncbi:hypothetical protein GGI21_002443 [Coemansia aciculifera]|nr:hypothetical protein GGI21_002443 [Coemansia aciculifera]